MKVLQIKILKCKLKVLSYWNLNQHLYTDNGKAYKLKVLSYWNLNGAMNGGSNRGADT